MTVTGFGYLQTGLKIADNINYYNRIPPQNNGFKNRNKFLRLKTYKKVFRILRP